MSTIFTEFLSCTDLGQLDIDVKGYVGKSGSHLNGSMMTLSTTSLT